MTPAVKAVQRAKVSFKLHEYAHDKSSGSYALEAVAKLGIAAECVFKTLVIELDKERLAVAIIPSNSQLNMKLVAKAAQAKKAAMADKHAAMRATGYVLGGVSPLGQKKRLETLLDSSANELASIFVSAGKRGLEIELAPSDLVTLTNAKKAALTTRA